VTANDVKPHCPFEGFRSNALIEVCSVPGREKAIVHRDGDVENAISALEERAGDPQKCSPERNPK
jgi:hypothetical protein